MSEERFVFRGSSNIKAASYDPLTRRLTIDFHHGKAYPPIRGVSAETWNDFKGAESPGRYVNEHFKTIRRRDDLG